MPEIVNIGLIGSGAIVNHHAQNSRSIPNAKFAAVAEVKVEAAQKLALYQGVQSGRARMYSDNIGTWNGYTSKLKLVEDLPTFSQNLGMARL
jgi:predicted homoserine dehydrogenase-like protein